MTANQQAKLDLLRNDYDRADGIASGSHRDWQESFASAALAEEQLARVYNPDRDTIAHRLAEYKLEHARNVMDRRKKRADADSARAQKAWARYDAYTQICSR